jgi:cag pathogenicity island protein 24
MKYRRLSHQELELLTDDFVKFLAANTVTAQDWVQLKVNQPQEAMALIDLFSDLVMEKVYDKIDLLEQRQKDSLLFFSFQGDLMAILGIQDEYKTIDFSLDNVLPDLEKAKLVGFRSSKVLSKEQKLKEIHLLVESGCFIGRPVFFDTLNQLIS